MKIVRETPDVDSYGHRPDARYSVTCSRCWFEAHDLSFLEASRLEAKHVCGGA